MKSRLVVVVSLFVVLIAARLPAADVSIPQTMQRFVDEGQISGAVTLVAKDGKVVALDAIGQADLATKRPMTTDTLFWIASMTKPIVATSLMILQDEGKLSVNDPVAKYLPGFKDIQVKDGGAPKTPLTIAHLLSHTSGVQNPVTTRMPQDPSLAEYVNGIAAVPLQFEPGTQWKYGSGLAVVGRVVEVVSGTEYSAFCQQRIFKPLGMKDTTFNPTPEQRQRIATIYGLDKTSGQLTPTFSPMNNSDPSGPPKAPNPSGGLASTATDYFRFLQMVLHDGELDGARVLSPDAVKQMTTVVTRDLPAGFSPGMQWALGWGIVDKPQGATAVLSPGSFGHGGAFGTQGWVDPHRKAIYIMLIQRTGLQPNGDQSELRIAFQAAASKMLGE